MNRPLTSAELKAIAREKLLGNYGRAIAAYVCIYMIILIANLYISILPTSDSIAGQLFLQVSTLISAIISGLIRAGVCHFFLKLSCGIRPELRDVFVLFQENPKKLFTLSFIMACIDRLLMLPMELSGNYALTHYSPSSLLLFSVILVVFGGLWLIVSLMLWQVYYIFLDFPEYSVSQILKFSTRIMKRNKGRLFYILVSFLPLFLLGILSCGIGLLWVAPYMQAVYAEFYLCLIHPERVSI